MCTGFPFFLIFFEFCMLISNLVKPNFDQHLNKFQTWKWKTKPGSFLVTPKWSFCEVFESFKFNTQNHLSSHEFQITSKGRVNNPFLSKFFSPPCVRQPNQFELSVYDKLRTCALVYHFFDFFEFFMLISNLSLTNISTSFKHENEKPSLDPS